MKYAVVTGSTKGIGRAIAEMLLKDNYYVFLNYDSDDNAKEEFIRANIAYKDSFTIIKKDLSTWTSSQEFVNEILSVTNQIDCLIFSAGMTDRSKFDDIDYRNWEKAINININVPFYMVHSFRNHITPKDGRIIFIGSVCGVYPHAGSPVYGVSKAAVHQMAKELVKFFEPKGITVNAIVPGFVNTPRQMTKAPEHRKKIEDKVALHRFAESTEIASLCREVINNQYINGANLEITGGYCYF